VEDAAKVNEGIRRAVALMTAWHESDDSDTTFAVILASQDLAAAVANDKLLEESVDVIAGLMSLSGRLLAELERHTGQDISAILQRAGQETAG
jgi:hypothetical protein